MIFVSEQAKHAASSTFLQATTSAPPLIIIWWRCLILTTPPFHLAYHVRSANATSASKIHSQKMSPIHSNVIARQPASASDMAAVVVPDQPLLCIDAQGREAQQT